MDRTPVPKGQQVQTAGRIPIDTYILFSVAAVLVITVIVQITGRSQDTLVYNIMQFVQLLVIACCLVVTVWRYMTMNVYPLAARSVAGSAALGSFLSGLFAAMSVATSVKGFYVVIGMCVAIAAFAVLGLVILLIGDEEQKDEPQQVKGALSEPRIYPSQPPLPSAVNVPPPAPAPLVEIGLPIGVTQKPLFEDDPLYAIPHPRRACLFMEVKDSGPSVLSEDACAISPGETRFALCDGVSTSNFSRPWATALALQWIEEPLTTCDPEIIDQWLEKPRKRWQEWIYETWLPTINKRNHSQGHKEFSLQEAKQLADEGAAATLLGVTVDEKTSTWSAIAVGDTCLLHLSPAENKFLAFPLCSSAEFTDLPTTIYSRSVSSLTLSRRIKSKSQSYKLGDVLILATDALAAWLLKQIEEKGSEWQSLLHLTKNKEFVALVHQQRTRKLMNNDDATLVIVHL